jgi:hypothetical protein
MGFREEKKYKKKKSKNIYKQYYRVFPRASSLARAKEVTSRIWKETTAADHGRASVQEIDGACVRTKVSKHPLFMLVIWPLFQDTVFRE